MTQGPPPSDLVSIVSLIVAIVSLIAAIASAAIANWSRKDAKRIAELAHDEWAQQKWFDLYFSTNYAYDAMEKLQADSIVQKKRDHQHPRGELSRSCQRSRPSLSGDSSNGNGVSAVYRYRHALCRHFRICRRFK